MGLMPTNGSGITWAGTKFQTARLTHIRSKAITLNSVIIWLALRGDPVAFLVAPMRSNVLCAFLSIVSMAGNFTNNAILIIQLT